MVTHRLFGDPIMFDYFKNSRVNGPTSAILTTYEMLLLNVWADRTHRPSFFVLNFDISYRFRTLGPSGSVDSRPSTQL
jgi:hypothetical protein